MSRVSFQMKYQLKYLPHIEQFDFNEELRRYLLKTHCHMFKPKISHHITTDDSGCYIMIDLNYFTNSSADISSSVVEFLNRYFDKLFV